MTAFVDFFQVLWRPRAVFERLTEKPRWIAATLVILLGIGFFTVLSAPAQTEQALAELEKRADTMEPGQLESAKAFMKSPAMAIIAAAGALVGAVFGLAVKSGLFHLGGTSFGGRANFAGALGVVMYSSAPLAIRNFLGGAVAAATGEPMAEGMSALLPMADRVSALGSFLAGIDLFVFWSLFLGVVGLSAVYKLDRNKALFVTGGFWLLTTVLRVGAAAVSSSLAGV